MTSLMSEKKNQPTHRLRKQTGGCQKVGAGQGKWVKVVIYKINKFWGCNVQHGNYS